MITVVNGLISSTSCGSQPLPLLLLMTKRWHTLCYMWNTACNPPKPKPLITPGLSSPQLQRKGKCWRLLVATPFYYRPGVREKTLAQNLRCILCLERRAEVLYVIKYIYIYKLYLARRWGLIGWDCFVLFFCFNTLFPFGLFGCWVECRRLFGPWERSGPRDVSVYILYRCICRTSMFKSYLFT